MKPMPKTIGLILIVLSSCGQFLNNSSQDNIINQKVEVTKESTNEFKLDKTIINTIKDYYQTNFGKDSRLEESISDTMIYMTYYSIPKNDDDYEGFLISISIPLNKEQDLFGANSILEGDINNDGNSELLISVHTEGGGGGGNIWSQDIFSFISENGNYKLASITPDFEISGCDGSFRAKEIADNFVLGFSSCYGPDDPRCCPSEEYDVKVVFESGKLKYRSKSKKN
jgi:hypothetical protein